MIHALSGEGLPALLPCRARVACPQPCGRRSRAHIGTQLRCYEPRGAMSCGSPMPRGERIAKPAEWGTHTAGVCFFDSGLGKEDCMATHRALSVQRSRVPRHAATAAALALVLLPTGR